VNPAADYLPKAASTSSVNKVIRTAQGGRLHVAKVHTWGVESDDEVLDARHQFNGLPDLSRIRSSGLSPQAIRRNEMQMRESRDEFVDERQAYALSPPQRRRSDTVGANYSMPSNGYMGESPVGSPYAPRRQPAPAPTSPYSVPQRQTVAAPTSPYSPQRPAQPPVPRHQEQPLSPTGTRRVETIVDYEKKKQGPPVVKDGHSKFKITLIENGETKMEKEATLEIPEFMNKKDYLSEVGQRLLRDLREDADAVSAVTHVEVEVVEDVTNILKTYVIGERADDYVEEEMPQALHYEATADRTPSPIEQKKVEKIYVDTLTHEEEQWREPEKAEIKLMQEGYHFEGEGALKRTRRLETDDSLEIMAKVRCANAFADCDLIRREDSSNFTVHIAVPLVQAMSMILTRRRAQRRQQEFSKAFAMEQAGQFFEEESSLRRLQRRVESAEEEDLQAQTVQLQEQEAVLQKAVISEVAVEKEKRVREIEAEGGSYEMEQQGLKLVGEAVIKRRGRAFDSESSEEILPPKRILWKNVKQKGWNGGSPTVVDLVKKESDSYFDVVFETVNTYEPQSMQIKRAVMKKASCEVNSAFMVPSDDSEETSVVRKAKSVWSESYSGKELSEQYANVTVALQNIVKQGEKDLVAECNLAAVSRSKAQGRFREMREEQAMMLYGFENTKPRIGEANVVRKEKNLHAASFLTAAAEFEHVTLTTGLSHSGEMLGVQSSSKTPNTISVAAKLNEMSLEHATSVIYLQKMPGIQDQSADGVLKDKHVRGEFLRTRAASDSAITSHLAIKRETSLPSMISIQKNLATANTTSSAMRAWASESHAISSTLMLNKGANVQTAAVKIRDHHRQEAMTHVAEYGQAQEHCAVMLKNTGGAHGATSAAMAEAVTDLRIRRKDAASEVTVYFMYKQVLGNYAMAALGLYLGDRIRKVREEHLTKEVLHTSEKLFQSESLQTEYTDEFERREASRHLVTDLRSGTKGIEKHDKETMTIQEQQQLQIQTGKLTKSPAQYASATAIAREQQISQAMVSMQESKFEEEIATFGRVAARQEYVGTDRLIEQVQTESAVVSAKATTQEDVGASVVHLRSEDYIEESRLVRPLADHEAASQQFREATDESAVGFWTTSDLDMQVEGRLLQKTASSQSIERRLAAVSEEDTAAEASLEWQPSKSAQGVLKQKEEEMIAREFKVKSGVQDASIIRKEEVARGDITLLDIEKETVTSRAFEFGQESSSLQGMFGKLIPKPESAEEVDVDRVASVTLQQKIAVTASKEKEKSPQSASFRKKTQYLVGSASKEESCSLKGEVLSQQPRSESSEVLVMGRHEEAVQIKSSASSEMEAFGFWDTNVPIEDTSRTLRTKSYESLVLSKKLRGSTESQTQVSSEITQEAKEERAVKWKQAQSASVDKAFGIAAKADEFLMSKPMTSAGSTGTLQERRVAKQKQMVRQYSDESALLFGSIGSLTPRTPESEEISLSLSDVPVLRGGAFMMASSEEVIQATDKMKRDDSAKSAELSRKIGAFESAKLSSKGSTESKTALSTMHCSESQESASAQATLAMAVRDVISLMSPESTEEFISSLWKTGEVEGGTASVQIGVKEALSLSKSMPAIGQLSTDYAGELTKEVRGERTATLPEIPADATGRAFAIDSREDHVALSATPKSMTSSEVFSTTSREATFAKLQEYGREAVDLKSVVGTLSAPVQPSEEAATTLPTKVPVLLNLSTKASSEHVAELLKLLSKHEQLVEMSLIKKIVLKEKDKLSVGAVRSLSTAVSLALEKASESSNIGATIAARLHEECNSFMHFASEEFVSGTWRTVAGVAQAHSQWPEHLTAVVEQKSKAPALMSSSVEVTLGMSPEETTLYRSRLPLVESVQRLFHVELEKALSEIRRKEASESETATIPVSITENVTGMAREYGKAEVLTQGVVGTLQQPEESQDSVETIQRRFSSIQAIYSTKASKEEHAELIRSLERFQDHESIGKILNVLRTEQLKFSGFATRTLLKAVEQELSRAPDEVEVSCNVAEAVKTVLFLAIKEVVDENAFAIIRSSKNTSEATLVLTLSSVERLIANVPAYSELSEEVSSHFTRPMSSSISSMIPVQHRINVEQRFGISADSLATTVQRESSQLSFTGTLKEKQRQETSAQVREFGQESVEVLADLMLLGKPPEQEEELELIRKQHSYIQFLHSVEATSEEHLNLVKLLSKYDDDEDVAIIIRDLESGRIAFSGIATKTISTAVEKEIERSSQSGDISRKVSEASALRFQDQ
ncbi:hypothetical protein OSTOST_20376, partial [Ostertagia ostertagi]